MIKLVYNKLNDIQSQLARDNEYKQNTIAGQAKTIEEQQKLIEALIEGEASKLDCEFFVFKAYRDKHPIVYSDGERIDTSYADHVDVSWYYGEAADISVEG